jgi:hypothetical protein
MHLERLFWLQLDKKVIITILNYFVRFSDQQRASTLPPYAHATDVFRQHWPQV